MVCRLDSARRFEALLHLLDAFEELETDYGCHINWHDKTLKGNEMAILRHFVTSSLALQKQIDEISNPKTTGSRTAARDASQAGKLTPATSVPVLTVPSPRHEQAVATPSSSSNSVAKLPTWQPGLERVVSGEPLACDPSVHKPSQPRQQHGRRSKEGTVTRSVDALPTIYEQETVVVPRRALSADLPTYVYTPALHEGRVDSMELPHSDCFDSSDSDSDDEEKPGKKAVATGQAPSGAEGVKLLAPPQPADMCQQAPALKSFAPEQIIVNRNPKPLELVRPPASATTFVPVPPTGSVPEAPEPLRSRRQNRLRSIGREGATSPARLPLSGQSGEVPEICQEHSSTSEDGLPEMQAALSGSSSSSSGVSVRVHETMRPQ